MKAIAEDFKDQLAGEPDKIINVGLVKDMLKTEDYKCTTTRRKTAKSYKIYFHITRTNPNISGYSSPWWQDSIILIKTLFPDAHLTSGSIDGWTIAEY